MGEHHTRSQILQTTIKGKITFKNGLKLHNLANFTFKFKAEMIFVSDAIRDVDDGITHRELILVLYGIPCM